LYDWLIDDYNAQQIWSKDKIKAPKDSLSRIIIASELLVNNTNINVDKTDFTSINVNTTEEELSIRLNECILQSLSDFYISTKTAKARTDLEKIGFMKDSLKNSLDMIERALAGMTDENLWN
jgi:hypothetical protein